MDYLFYQVYNVVIKANFEDLGTTKESGQVHPAINPTPVNCLLWSGILPMMYVSLFYFDSDKSTAGPTKLLSIQMDLPILNKVLGKI